KGALTVAVKRRRRIGRDHIGQGAAVLRLLVGRRRQCTECQGECGEFCCIQPTLRHTGEGRCPFQPWVPAFAGTTKENTRYHFFPYLSSQTVARSWFR